MVAGYFHGNTIPGGGCLMAQIGAGGAIRLIQSLWDAGTLAALDDAELLERFLARDATAEVAFADLVRRHAPMVLRVCREVTGNPHDAEDAAQVTFLVLARQARSIHRGESLANWLFGTARRVAARSVREAVRRRRYEHRYATTVELQKESARSAQPEGDRWAERHEELGRLPERYRTPIILCDLEGLTHERAAVVFGCPLKTLQTRLYRGRDRLRERLQRRGAAQEAMIPAGALPAVPTEWAGRATAAAIEVAAGRGVATLVSGAVNGLLRGVNRAMILSHLMQIAAVLVLAGVGVSAGLSFALAPGSPRRQGARPAQGNPGTTPITVRGRATDGAGRPVAGATIYLVSTNGKDALMGTTTTDRDGAYHFRHARLPVSRWGQDPDAPRQGTFQVYGTAPGHGFAWHGLRCYQPRRRPDDWGKVVGGEYTLFGEDPKVMDLSFPPAASLAGRVVDEAGRPVAGVRIRIVGCDYLDTGGKESHPNFREFWTIQYAYGLPTLTTTDSDGRFRLEGLPKEAGFRRFVEHPEYAWMNLYAATTDRPASAFDYPRQSIAGGTRPLVATGEIKITLHATRRIAIRTVFDDTGQPAAKVRVSAGTAKSSGSSGYGVSDADGRLQLRLPPGEYSVVADPTLGGAECLRALSALHVADRPAEQPFEVRVKPASVVVLEAVDAKTGQGIRGVQFDGEHEPGGQVGGRMPIQSRPGYVDNPRSDANGRLRAIVEPGKWIYFVAHVPESAGYGQPRLERRVILSPRGTVTVRFELQK